MEFGTYSSILLELVLISLVHYNLTAMQSPKVGKNMEISLRKCWVTFISINCDINKWSCSVVSDSVTPWTVAHQAPPSMEFSRQEYWSGLPFPSPGDLPNPGIELGSPALQADALPSEPPGNQKKKYKSCGLSPLALQSSLRDGRNIAIKWHRSI